MTRAAAVLLTAFVLVLPARAFATWSIVAADKRTGTVVIASAACVPQARFANFPARDLMDIQAIVAPGKGVAAAQASVDPSRATQKLIFDELQKGTAPADILPLLLADPKAQTRQYAIVDLQGRGAALTGIATTIFALDRQDKVGDDIIVSVQGNTLASADVVFVALQAFKAAPGTLADRVMAAMEAADSKGGDKRCSCATLPPLVDGKNPLAGIPCEAKTAHVAYILRAEATDTNGSSFNDGQYAMYISVTDQDVTKKENANPVKTLRKRYDAWVKARAREE